MSVSWMSLFSGEGALCLGPVRKCQGVCHRSFLRVLAAGKVLFPSRYQGLNWGGGSSWGQGSDLPSSQAILYF